VRELLPSLWQNFGVRFFVQPSGYQPCVVSKREHIASSPWLSTMNLFNKNHAWLSRETFVQLVIVKDIAWQHWHVEISASFCVTVELNNISFSSRIDPNYDHIDRL
jgi:hypothetical protein